MIIQMIFIFPREGYRAGISAEYAGIGGDSNI